MHCWQDLLHVQFCHSFGATMKDLVHNLVQGYFLSSYLVVSAYISS